MASIARRTLMNLFDCIRCFFLRGIETACIPSSLCSENKRYCHMQIGEMFTSRNNGGFENQTAKMLLNISQSIQEAQQTTAMAFITASLSSPMSNVLLKSPCSTATKCFEMEFPVDDLEHIVPDDDFSEELPCSFIDSTPSYCYFIVKNIDCTKSENKSCRREQISTKRLEVQKSNNIFKTNFADEDLTTKIDISNVGLTRGRTYSESSDDNFIFFIEDDIDCKESSASSKNYGYYSNQYDLDEESLSSSEESSDEDDEDCIIPSEKKVRFDLNPKVHVMHTWNFAYRTARKGHWENVARDRVRFHNRIQKAVEYLDPILAPEHRQKIYETRFCCENIQTEPKTLDKLLN